MNLPIVNQETQTAFEQQVVRLVKDPSEIQSTLTPNKVDMLHMTMGLAGEFFELEEATRNLDTENLVEELGDFEFYFQGLRNALLREGDALNFDYSQEFKDVPNPCFVRSTGNLIDMVKKYVVYNDASRFKACIEAFMTLESALSSMYAVRNEYTRDEVLIHNLNKLSGKGGRYENGYSDEAAKIRADKK